jgi:hypothetical protein
MADEASSAGHLISALIAKELENSRTTATSVQARGLAVISTSGTLVTLLFGLSALATKTQNLTLTSGMRMPLYLAAIFLVLAAVAGLATNAPRRKDLVAFTSLRRILDSDQDWNAPAFHAERAIARAQLTIAETARNLSIRMARFLQVAITLELLGIGCVVWAVIVPISTPS